MAEGRGQAWLVAEDTINGQRLLQGLGCARKISRQLLHGAHVLEDVGLDMVVAGVAGDVQGFVQGLGRAGVVSGLSAYYPQFVESAGLAEPVAGGAVDGQCLTYGLCRTGSVSCQPLHDA